MKKLRNIVIGFLCLAAPLYADVKKESRHFLTTEVGLGYSALLNQSALGKSSGLVGGKLQVGYEWNYRHLLVHTGLEFASINDRSRVQSFTLETPYTIGLPAGQQMNEHFEFQSFSETQYMGQINIPIQVGGWFANRYYFLAGMRLGLPVVHSASTRAQVRTYLTDPTLIGGLGEHEEVPVHDAYTSNERFPHAWAASLVNAQLSAEVGVVLNSFFEKPQKGKSKSSGHGKQPQKKPILYRVGLFADYGVTSCRDNTASPIDLASVSQPREITINDYYQASQTPIHSLLVGAKFAVLFQLNEQKPDKPLPSFFDIYIADAITSQPLAAHVDIYDSAKKRSVGKDTKNGRLHYRAKAGDYTITASNNLYYPAIQDATTADEGVNDTIRMALRPRPWLRLRITNTDTGEPLSVAVRLQNSKGDSVTTLQTVQETGVARTMLDEKQSYSLRIEQTGYETLIRDIAYAGDSLNLTLTPIKVGRKVVLHNLFFATNKTRILPQSEQALDELYEFLRDNPSLVIRITGHTDNVGSDQANQILSEGRAEAVRDEIIKRGIASERIEAEGKGETEPIDSNETEEGRANNRRVEFTIISTGGANIEQIHE